MVVPAHAGVILLPRGVASLYSRRPRTRGGHPPMWQTFTAYGSSSPHTRGSSVRRLSLIIVAAVVPAHAGVIRAHVVPGGGGLRRPRTRGGHPTEFNGLAVQFSSSPHTRGSSSQSRTQSAATRVVPAHAGVIRPGGSPGNATSGRPRTRGGHPSSTLSNVAAIQSSPHTRGSSGQPRPHQHGYDVVPAHAGVIPPTRPGPTRAGSRPRTRGGHPQRPQHRDQRRPSSPHTRGTSVCDDHHQRTRRVVPAHAGVIPR